MITVKVEKTENDLLDLVLSWSLPDILDKNFFINKVNKIPDHFLSVAEYLASFHQPLIEETRASLSSSLENVGEAPACEIFHLVPYKIKSKLSKVQFGYHIQTRRITSFKNPGGDYEPQSGDLILLTNVRLRGLHDLNVPENFMIASVSKVYDQLRLLTSKEISLELRPKGPNRIYAIYLVNMITNMRIWWALNRDPNIANVSLIEKVLRYDSAGDDDCTLCLSQENSTVTKLIASFKLDEPQTNAVLSCTSIRNCPHQVSKVKLIWGPPGTGKTKTVASLLFVLPKLKCRVLTCAPTNIAVLQVAERLMSLVLASLDNDTYGLGNIVLLGNGERMKVDDHNVLVDIFLDYRVEILSQSIPGWRPSLGSMISLLEDPERMYNEYVSMHKRRLGNEKRKGKQRGSRENKRKQQNNLYDICVKDIRKGSKQNEQNSNAEVEPEPDILMTLAEFVMKSFYSLADRLMFCAKNLYTHLPSSSIPLDVAKQMIRLNHMFKILLSRRNKNSNFEELTVNKKEILKMLKSLQKQFPGPKIKGNIQKFCLSRACLVFCTASSSIKVRSKVEMVNHR